jgi:lysozyme
LKKLPIILVILLAVLLVFAAILERLGHLHFGKPETPRSFMYTDFGVYVPTQYTIYGIDVSRYQNRINWSEVNKMKVQNIAIRFAFIKATEGKEMKDKRFKENWKEAKQNHIIRGAYHYYLPDGNPGQQSKNFLETVKFEPGDLPPVVDIEDRGIGIHKSFIANIKIFLAKVEEKCKCKPIVIVYSYDSFYNDYLTGQLEGYPIWLARYGPEKPLDGNFDFWQFTDHAQVDGIGEKVDMNVFAGDSLKFQALLLK